MYGILPNPKRYTILFLKKKELKRILRITYVYVGTYVKRN